MPVTVSCLVPVYNGEKYLSLALDSILNQSYKDFEIIVVNDGSFDGSAAILASYAEKFSNVRVFTKENGGIVDALNFGLMHCDGKYIARMDCDDIAMPDRFERQLAEFAKRPDAVAVGGYIRWMDENGVIDNGPAISPSRVSKTDLNTFPPKVANVQHSAGMFSKAAMLAIGGYRSTFPHAEDYDLYLRLAQFGKFYNPSQPVIFYRQHSSSLSALNLLRQETSAALAEISAYARKAGVPDPGDAQKPLSLAEYNSLLGDAICPRDTVARYIDFRMFRRTESSGLSEAGDYLKKVKSGIFNIGNYGNSLDRKLNLRIILSIAKMHWTKLTHKFRRQFLPVK